MGTIHTAEFDTSYGTMRVASSERGLAYLQLPRASGRGFDGWLRRHAEGEEVRAGYEPNRAVITQVTEYLEGKRRDFDLPLDLRATDFQLCAYEALLAIPYGETRSYAEQAQAIGRPKAVRAVGTANGANPISIVVPCHRVVASGGKLGGYGGGLPMKKKLLAMEHASPLEGDLL